MKRLINLFILQILTFVGFSQTRTTSGDAIRKEITPKFVNGVIKQFTISQLKTQPISNGDSTTLYYVIDTGKKGYFELDKNDNSSVGNDSTIIVTNNGKRLKRTIEQYLSPSTTGKYYRGDKTWQDLSKSTIGLSNVDNTSDLNKPISTATQTALLGKLDKGYSISELRGLTNSVLAATQIFYCNEIGKEGFWYYDSADNVSSDNMGTVLVTSSSKRLKRIFTGGIYPEWFGAVADGSTDCTTAIQAAVNYKYLNSTNGSDRVIIFSGKGIYLTGSISLPGDGTITIKGTGLYSAYIKLKNGANASLFVVNSGDCVPYFENLYLDGNKSNQTSTLSHGIEYQDAVDATYRRAGMIYNCNIVYFKGDGVHGGQYKQLLRITNTDVRGNDGHGVYQPLNNADWFVNSGDFGNNGKSNFYISSQVQITNASIYYAGESNIYFGDHCRWSSVVNSLIDHAGKHGIEVSTSNTNPCGINISGNRFYVNSQNTTNTYSHISLLNANGVIISNNHFIRVPGQDVSLGDAKYLLETTNSTKTNFFGNTWDSGSYLTGITNNMSVLGSSNDSYFGLLRLNGNIKSTKNISFTETISGSENSNVLGINRIVFGSGDPTQVLGAGRISKNANNDQMQIDYGAAGLVVRNNGLSVSWFSDVLNRTFFNTTTTYPSAQVAINSTNRGFLPPRLTSSQESSVSSPETGLEIFNTDFASKKYYNGVGWVMIQGGVTKNISADYTILKTDRVIVVSSGSYTLTLPTAVGLQDKEFVIVNNGSGTLTINTTSSQTIDGSSSLSISAGTRKRIMANSSNYITL